VIAEEEAIGRAKRRVKKKQSSAARRESWHKTDPEVDSEVMRGDERRRKKRK
jgi:hypothetical protein